MIWNILVSAFRNLKKNYFFSLLNMIGLAVGTAVFLLIAQYTRFERSYEDFVPNRSNIYRVSLSTYAGGQLKSASAENYPAVGPELKKDVPEVISYARLYNMGYKNNVIITNESASPNPISIKQRRFLYADSAFLPMMGYEMIRGDRNSALAEANTAVISETQARLYFGNADPIGKTLHLHDDDSNDELARVTGVFKDIPVNSHIKFDVLFSYKTLYQRGNWALGRYNQSWRRTDMYTYVALRNGTDPKLLQSKLSSIIEKNKPELKENHQVEALALQPLKDIHLRSDLAEEFELNGSATTVFFIGLIGIFVLVIAWINYVNLSTARALSRAKEVGVRKVAGASKSQLILQFIVESALLNLCSVILAFGIMSACLTYFDELSGLSISTGYLLQPWFLLLSAGVWVIGTLMAGFYPALVLSSFKPVTVLKGLLKNTERGVFLRKALVTAQFGTSVALISGTFIVYSQLHFLLHQQLGMNLSQVLWTDRPGIAANGTKDRVGYSAQIDRFRDELRKSPDIEAVTSSITIPGFLRENKVTAKRYGVSNGDSISANFNSMDFDFLNVFKMKMIAGRAFSKTYPKDPDTSVIVTATAAKLLGFKTPNDAVGKLIELPQFDAWKPLIVGVVNDYHQVSLKKPLEPGIFACWPYDGEYYSIRVRTANIDQAVRYVEKTWNTVFPGNPFEYAFLDDYFNRQYANEQRFEKLFRAFATLAILISCLGLFGLSAYAASQRVKEIGIRKILGASLMDITLMLSRDFLTVVIVSILIASPLAFWAMHSWLENFAYRIDISWWIFVGAGLISLLIAVITISFQAIKAAMANPIKNLRIE
jgi:putative ABC transport system permease protein